ncbi:MAG: SGNH/GDSL hydrolase family protein [Deltaproteobacteria bacterium]|nr:SGNH/GDSL hydrolase family protein [Deltaproteobacteria bacterium]
MQLGRPEAADPKPLQNFLPKASLPRLGLYACLLPVAMVEGHWLRRTVPRLAEAAGPRAGVAGRGAPLRLLVVGDSSAAGVGVATQDQALCGRLLAGLRADFRLTWLLVAKSGWLTRELRQALREIPPREFDVAVTATGVNDLTDRFSTAECLAEIVCLVELLRRRFAVRHVLVTGMPPAHRLPTLPEPLRWYLGDRAKRLDASLCSWAGRQADCDHLSMQGVDVSPREMAVDGFHPGPGIYACWGQAAARKIRARWLARGDGGE